MSADKAITTIGDQLKRKLQQSVDDALSERMLQLLKQLDERPELEEKLKAFDLRIDRERGQC